MKCMICKSEVTVVIFGNNKLCMECIKNAMLEYIKQRKKYGCDIK